MAAGGEARAQGTAEPLASLDGEGVGPRLALLCLQRDGRLTESRWAVRAVRAGLLVDLALAGRLIEGEDHIELLPGPGAPLSSPAEALAQELVGPPPRTLSEVVDDGAVGLDQLAADLVARGLWIPQTPRLLRWGTRYRAASPRLSRAELMPVVADIAPGGVGVDAGWAATAVLAAVAGLLAGEFRPADEHLVEACGSAAWVVQVAVDDLESARSHHAIVARATRRDLHTPG
ncbi:GPP34 family phosphoprotein [Geodermatophilus sp. SYSU D00696]